MYTNGDVLGEEGRKALDACVKVKIYGRPESTRRYDSQTALGRLRDCYSGRYPNVNGVFLLPGYLAIAPSNRSQNKEDKACSEEMFFFVFLLFSRI